MGILNIQNKIIPFDPAKNLDPDRPLFDLTYGQTLTKKLKSKRDKLENLLFKFELISDYESEFNTIKKSPTGRDKENYKEFVERYNRVFDTKEDYKTINTNDNDENNFINSYKEKIKE